MTRVYTATLPDGTRADYTDRKRLSWSLSVVWPLLPFVGLAAHADAWGPSPYVTLRIGPRRPGS